MFVYHLTTDPLTRPFHAGVDLVDLLQVGQQLGVLYVEICHAPAQQILVQIYCFLFDRLGYVLRDLVHVAVLCEGELVHLLQQAVLLRGALQLSDRSTLEIEIISPAEN